MYIFFIEIVYCIIGIERLFFILFLFPSPLPSTSQATGLIFELLLQEKRKKGSKIETEDAENGAGWFCSSISSRGVEPTKCNPGLCKGSSF